MGKIKQGILGGFSGKVGTVVGSFWKGRSTMRALAPNVHNPKTEGQEAARARFALVGRFSKNVLAFINNGYKHMASAMALTGPNCFMRNCLATAISGSGTAVTLDYTRVPLTAGNGLLNVESPSVQAAAAGHSVNVSWTNNAGISTDVLDDDMVLLCLYNPSKQESTYDMQSATRVDQAAVITYPATWAGDTVYLYLATESANQQRISNSTMVGSVTAI